ncbi:MAG: opacity protein-like surface antigen [Arenicella sp.]|jgi:opacity protein-like surface antigen
MEGNNQYDGLEKKVQEKLSGFEHAPPSLAWGTIAEQTKTPTKSWWKRMLPILFLFFLGGTSGMLDILMNEETANDSVRYERKTENDKQKQSAFHENNQGKQSVRNKEATQKPAQLAVEKANDLPKQNVAIELKAAIATKRNSKPILSINVNKKIKPTFEASDKEEVTPVIIVSLNKKNQEVNNSILLAEKRLIDLKMIKASTLLTESVLASFSIQSQQIQYSSPKKKWNAVLEISPNYTFMRYSDNTAVEILENPNKPQSFSTRNLGFSLGIGVEKEIKNKLKVYFSANYSLLRKRLEFRSKPIVVSINSDSREFFDPSFSSSALNSGGVGGNEITIATSENTNFHLIGLKGGINKSIFSSKTNQSLRVGVGLDFLIHSKFTDKSPLILEKNGFFHPSVLLGYEWKKRVSENSQIGFGPTVNYYFRSFTSENSTVLAKPYTLGFGVRLHLGASNQLE